MRERLLRIFPAASAALLLPMILWLGIMVFGAGIPGFDAAGASAFRIYYLALASCLLVGAVLLFLEKSYGKALICLGAILILIQGILLYGFRFSSAADIGEGESLRRLDPVASGPWARPDLSSLTLAKIYQEPRARCVMLLNGMERDLAQGENIVWKGLRIRLRDVFSAPLFILGDAKGTELEGGYFKLALREKENESFQFRIVPHRFYVSLPGKETRRWIREGGTWKTIEPEAKREIGEEKTDKLHVRIMRGKLTLFNGEVKKGEDVKFDGHSVRFQEGSAWARIEIVRVLRPYALYAGLAMIASGAALTLFSRRKP